jgi:hypothetical protein
VSLSNVYPEVYRRRSLRAVLGTFKALSEGLRSWSAASSRAEPVAPELTIDNTSLLPRAAPTWVFRERLGKDRNPVKGVNVLIPIIQRIRKKRTTGGRKQNERNAKGKNKTRKERQRPATLGW